MIEREPLTAQAATDQAEQKQPQRTDSGSITVWFLVLIPLMLGVAGLGLDLWRVISDRGALAEAADASARAGANGIDEIVFDETGTLILDPVRAEELAQANLDEQAADTLNSLTRSEISATNEQVLVVLDGEIDMTLLRIFGTDSVKVRVESEAKPQPSS
jgi:Flp pilus assembly protein TadG